MSLLTLGTAKRRPDLVAVLMALAAFTPYGLPARAGATGLLLLPGFGLEATPAFFGEVADFFGAISKNENCRVKKRIRFYGTYGF